MRRIVISLALAAITLTPALAIAAEGDERTDTHAEDAAIDAAVAEAERAALSPPAPLAVRKDRPLVTAPEAEGLGLAPKLALCALLAGALFWLVRSRLLGRRNAADPERRTSRPQVLSRTAIGLRHEVVVIEVEGQRFLLGVAPGSIASLGVLPDESALAREEDERDVAPPLLQDEPLSDGLARLIAASRASNNQPAQRSLGFEERVSATGVHERPRPVRDALDEPRAARTPAQPRRRPSRPGATANDTAAEGQVRGLPTRRAAP